MQPTIAAAGDFSGLPLAPFVPLFIALCCIASLFGIFCLCRLVSSNRKPWHFIGLLAAAPFSVIATQFFFALHTQHRRHEGGEFTFILPPMAREYAQLYPGRIRRIGFDEECSLEGFTQWFQPTVAERKRNWPAVLKIFSYRGDAILDPQGIPVAYACDFNLDGVIDFRGQHFQVIPHGDPVGYDFKLAVIWHPNRSDEHVPILFY